MHLQVLIHTAAQYYARVLQVRASDGETLTQIFDAPVGGRALTSPGVVGTIELPAGTSFCQVTEEGVVCHFPPPDEGPAPAPQLISPAQVAHDLSISICGELSI